MKITFFSFFIILVNNAYLCVVQLCGLRTGKYDLVRHRASRGWAPEAVLGAVLNLTCHAPLVSSSSWWEIVSFLTDVDAKVQKGYVVNLRSHGW